MFDDVINQWDKNVYPEMLFHSFSCCIALRRWRPDVRGLLIVILFLLAIVHAILKSPSNASSECSRISRKDVASVRA
jgi:hypothetical protein